MLRPYCILTLLGLGIQDLLANNYLSPATSGRRGANLKVLTRVTYYACGSSAAFTTASYVSLQ